MHWGRTQKELDVDDNEIIIGANHPMRYAFSIAVIAHHQGACKVHIPRGRSFICRYTKKQKTIEDRWQEVKRFIFEQAKMRILEEDNDNDDEILIVVSW